MAPSTRLGTAVLIVLSLCRGETALGEPATPRGNLRTYSLPNNSKSADISPNEELVVTGSEKRNDGADSATEPFIELVQVWKFKEEKLVAESAEPAAADRRQVIVRFAPDGKTVAALIGRTIHVLRVSDLIEISSVSLDYPSELERGQPTIPAYLKPSLKAMELSLNGNSVAVLWVSQMHHGTVQLYDLSSGGKTLSWNTPQGWIYFTKGFAWNPDGESLVIAIPNETPCSSPGNHPDIFAFDAETGAITRKLTSGLLAGGVAVSSDQRVLAVDVNCLGVFTNRDPKLRVFDLTTGRHLRSVSGSAGVRYAVSASAGANRFLAYTGKMTISFDWLDFTPGDVVVDETFTVWNSTTYEEIATSQNIPGLKDSELRLSSDGRYAVSSGKASFVYELP
jgi:WD40 repeat protein